MDLRAIRAKNKCKYTTKCPIDSVSLESLKVKMIAIGKKFATPAVKAGVVMESAK
jgi:hypothetical protein